MVDAPVPGLCLIVDVVIVSRMALVRKQRHWIPYEPAGSNLDTVSVMNRHCLTLRVLDEQTESCFVYVCVYRLVLMCWVRVSVRI
jgi:hypothetical protein